MPNSCALARNHESLVTSDVHLAVNNDSTNGLVNLDCHQIGYSIITAVLKSV